MGEEETIGGDRGEDRRPRGGGQNAAHEQYAFRDAELQQLLRDIEEEEEQPLLAILGSPPEASQEARQSSAQRAAREVERILEMRDADAVLGGGTVQQQSAEYRRLVRLLHPDKGLASGQRANLALRRVVECHRRLLLQPV